MSKYIINIEISQILKLSLMQDRSSISKDH